MKRIGTIPYRAGYWKNPGVGGNIPSIISVCPWALLIVITNAMSIRNRLLHGLKGVVGSDGLKWLLVIRILFLKPITSVALQCSWMILTVMCCHRRRPREGNRLYTLSWLSTEVRVSVLTLESLLKTVIEKKLMNTKKFSIHANFRTLQTRRFLYDLLSCSVDHDVVKLT
jgi:hypothetical protein